MSYIIGLGFVSAFIFASGCATLSVSNYDPQYRDVKLSSYITRFQEMEAAHPGPFPKSISISNSGKATPHLLVGCMIHGDEIGCLPAVLDFIDGIQAQPKKFSGKLTVFIGNPRAATLNRRFIEQDLNRVFVDSAPASSEKERAKEISTHLNSADLFIDFHQTIEPTDRSFYTFAFNKLHYQWAKYLSGARVLVTRPSHVQFAKGMLSATEYASQAGVPALTLELNQKGFSDEAYAKTLGVLEKATQGLMTLKSSRNLVEVTNLASKNPALKLYTRVHSEPFDSPQKSLSPGYKNFSVIDKGATIGTVDGIAPLTAKESGVILFPKYPPRDRNRKALSPLPSDIFLLLRETTFKELNR